jgi:hypothetical protein
MNSKLEYYSATKKNETLSLAAKHIELEDIMLGAICQTQKDKYYLFFCICAS